MQRPVLWSKNIGNQTLKLYLKTYTFKHCGYFGLQMKISEFIGQHSEITRLDLKYYIGAGSGCHNSTLSAPKRGGGGHLNARVKYPFRPEDVLSLQIISWMLPLISRALTRLVVSYVKHEGKQKVRIYLTLKKSGPCSALSDFFSQLPSFTFIQVMEEFKTPLSLSSLSCSVYHDQTD